MTDPHTWRAGPDGVSHATRKGATRTRCNRLPVLERWAWPGVSKCPTCVGMIEEDARRD
jgi:hypothetical protein